MSPHQPLGIDPLDLSASKRRSILAGAWLATFLASLNTTIVATLLPVISSSYNQANHASWLGTSYLLATCTFTPMYGRFCSTLGRRRSNQLAILLACSGALLCGLSPNLETLVLARFIGGIGGGGIFMTATIITNDLYSLRDRGMAQGIANIFNGLGTGLGGPVGGWINDRVGWRMAFLFQIPLYFASFMLTHYNLHYSTPKDSLQGRSVIQRIDYGGFLLFFGSISSLLLFLNFKFSDDMPWSSLSVVSTLSLALTLFIGFMAFELTIAVEPILEPSLLYQKVPVAIAISHYCVGLNNLCVTYFVPLLFQTVFQVDPSTAGLHLLPNSISLSTGSLFAGWIIRKTGRYRTMSNIFGIFPCLSTLSLAFLSRNSPFLLQWLAIIPLGFGNAVVLQTSNITLLAHVEHDSMPLAIAFGQLWRGVGQVSGVAIGSALFQSLLVQNLRDHISGPNAPNIINDIRQSFQFVQSLPAETQLIVQKAYILSLTWVFLLASLASLSGYISRLTYPEKSLDDDPRLCKKRYKARSIEGNHPLKSLKEQFEMSMGKSTTSYELAPFLPKGNP